jgi:hypothetical protein
MIHIFIECALTMLVAAVGVGWYKDGTALRASNARLKNMLCENRHRIVRLWVSQLKQNCQLRSQVREITDRYRRSVLVSRRRQKRASLRVSLLKERHWGAIDALTAKHEEVLANLQSKRQRVIDEAAPHVGEAVRLRDIVEFLEGERENLKAGVIMFGKQLDVAKASADLMKVGMALKEWIKGWSNLDPNNLLPAPLKKLSSKQ